MTLTRRRRCFEMAQRLSHVRVKETCEFKWVSYDSKPEEWCVLPTSVIKDGGPEPEERFPSLLIYVRLVCMP
jgi:hypothetical protein